MGKLTARTGERVLGALAVVGLAVTAVMALVVAPPDRPPPVGQGDLYRILYVHVPAAWLAYLCFGVVFVGSIAYLRTGRSRWDRLAASSAEIGVVFTALAIVLGSIWGRPAWGAWWTWDPRLTTTAILLLIYVGYLAVRKLSDNPRRRGRWAAVVGIVGFADVPIVHLSVQWWRGLHQTATVQLTKVTLAPVMTATLMISLTSFTVLYAYLLALRLRVGRLEERAVAEALSPRLGRPASALLEEQEGERVLEQEGAGPVPDALVAHVNDLGYITAAWVVTGVGLGAYVAALLARARRARLRAEAIVARRDRVGRAASGAATRGPGT